MTAPIAPGIVTSLSPFQVQLGSDAPGGQPCQRVAPAQIGQRGGVLILGGQRVWLGAYDKNDIDVSGLTARISALETRAAKVASGVVNVTATSAAGGTAVVTFPTGRFTAADILTAQVSKATSSFAKSVPYFRGLTSTGMTVGIHSGDGATVTSSTVTIHWRVEIAN